MCSLVKYGLFLVNLIFALAGLALLGVGIAVLLQLTDFSTLVDDVYVDAIPITTIVLGALTFLIAFFGCCGAIKENTCLLGTYGVCMLLLAAGKIFISVVTFQNWKDVGDNVKEWLNNAFNDTSVREAFHGLERTFSCCGPNGASSYGSSLPPSCCPENEPCNASNAFEGCILVVTDFLVTYSDVIGIVAIVIIIAEVSAMVFSFGLCRNVSKN